MPVDLSVPDIGDYQDVEVIEVLVKAGDAVALEQPLVTLESDKATMEIPASAAGVIQRVDVKVGDRVSKGSRIATVEVNGAEPAATQAPTPGRGEEPAATEQTNAGTLPARRAAPIPDARQGNQSAPAGREPSDARASSLAPGGAKPHASPAVRKFARELGVDLLQVPGTGPQGRVLQTDVQAYVRAALARLASSGHVDAATEGRERDAGGAPADGGQVPASALRVAPWPHVDFAKFGPVESKPLSRIKKISGANLHRNWVSIPHVTQFDEADITALEAFRKASAKDAEREGVRLTMLAFLVAASVATLKRFPQFNASLDLGSGELVMKRYFHIGVAVDTPDGLVVPVVRDADQKGVFQIARDLASLSSAAREKKLKAGDMAGGTFSISSLGGIGGSWFTPIINAPEVAILGASRTQERAVWNGERFERRRMLPLSLSYDHRVIDGADGARFTTHLAAVLEDPRRALLG